MKYHVTVIKEGQLAVEEFEFKTRANPDQSIAQWTEKSRIVEYLDKHYPNYHSYDVTLILDDESESSEEL